MKALYRRAMKLVEEQRPRDVMPSAATLRRLDHDPAWVDLDRREDLGLLSLREIDEVCPFLPPIPPELAHIKRYWVGWAACMQNRLDALVAWAVHRVGMEPVAGYVAEPGTAAWREARAVLRGELEMAALSGDRCAVVFLDELGELIARYAEIDAALAEAGKRDAKRGGWRR
jgi:hypothetical protein